MAPSESFITRHLSDTLINIEFLFDAKGIHKGKVRDTFEIKGNRIMIATDRQSAFDRVLAAVPFKGQVLNRISEFWFKKTEDIIKNHVIVAPDPNVMVVKKAKVFPIEVVVRGFLTGTTDTSAWTHYKNGVRDFCGIKLPDGMKKNEPFKNPIITPTTKDKNHDRPISAKEIIEEKRATPEQWEKISNAALKVFQRGLEICKKQGFILVDTKMEFGLDENNEIILIDELFTPDSSRFWRTDTYEQKLIKNEEPDNFDKEFLRLWFVKHCDPYKDKILPKAPDDLVVELARRYIEAFEIITGEPFDPALGEPTMLARIERNLEDYIHEKY